MESAATSAEVENRALRRMGKAAVTTAIFAASVKVVATLKEFLVAGIYGRSDAMDAFLIASMIPNLLINLFAESMNQALIPTLVRIRIKEGQARAQQLLSLSLSRLILLLVAASAALALLAPVVFPLFASNFSAPKLAASVQMFYALLPVVLLSGLASNCAAVLNTRGRFAVPAMAPALVPLLTAVSALLLWWQCGIWAMVWGTLLGAAAQTALVVAAMRSQGYRITLQWKIAPGSELLEPAREVARQYGPVLLSAVVASGGLLVDQAMAAMLPAGSVSALVYGGRYAAVIVTLFSGAIAAALTPHLSALVTREDWEGCRLALRHAMLRTALVSIPIAIALIAGAPLLVRLTLQHGVFSARDASVVIPVTIMYALQIPFFVLSRVPYRFILAMRRTDLILYCGIVNLVLDVALNLLLMRWMGLAGIALSTTLWTVSTLAFLWFWSRRLLRRASEGQRDAMQPHGPEAIAEPEDL